MNTTLNSPAARRAATAAPDDRIAIIGAGIGGLSLALTLARTGRDFVLFEQAPALAEVGAGLGLWSNATRLLEHLGLGYELRAVGVPVRRGQFARSDGRVLMDIPMSELARGIPGDSYILHRSDLHGILARHVPAERIRLGRTCTGVTTDGDGATAHFRDRSRRFAAVIGADGINSAVRSALHGARPPRYAGETIWRGVARLPYADGEVVREVSGPGRRVGICPLGPDRIYWWATEPAAVGSVVPPEKRKARMRALARSWAFGFPDLVEATPDDACLRNDALDRPPLRRWGQGAATLLGDAAHPATPNLGQGACMAIEDAWVLAQKLHLHGDPATAFRAYENARHARTAWITTTSYRMGRLGLWRNPAAVALREAMVRRTPIAVMRRLWEKQLAYDPGPLIA
jgi:2-polyprenyl-6-methoxyphenol hydroxylase-like FAD-dependent oxidoreductase